MFAKPSLMARIAIGKLLGLLFGLVGFFVLPMFWPEMSDLLRWGVLLWYITFGALIGMAGVMTTIPLLKLRLPGWLLSTFLGAWLDFVLCFFIYDDFNQPIKQYFGTDSVWASVWWIVLEGALLGFIIGFFCSHFGGEGPETAGR